MFKMSTEVFTPFCYFSYHFFRGRQHYHSKKKLENPPTPATTSSFTIQYYPEHRNQIFLTPPPTHSSNGRTISPLLPMHCSPTFLEPISPSPSLSHLFISPQSVSCAEILESSIEGDISNLTSPLCHEIPLQKPPTLWDPSAHPLLNLAALSEQLLTPVPALLSPSPSPPSEKKRKR